MPVHERFDPADPRLAPLRSMTDAAHRRAADAAHGTYVAESLPVLERAISAGHRVRTMLIAPRWLEQIQQLAAPDVDVFVGAPDLLAAVTGFDMHRGVIAVVERPAPRALDTLLDGRPLVVLENITDQANIGAIFRNAAALGAAGVVLTPTTGDPLYRRSIRVSMGTVFQVPWARASSWRGLLEALASAGYTTAALALDPRAVELQDYRPAGPVALVLGAEGPGLASEIIDAVDDVVMIPMTAGVDSLNVAATSAIALWHLVGARD
ncbi:TrmH family RNA methyltransferase [Microbacterium nymphoidis]|uniref:TrmH family RNA methyltransferase n=1 Tax=Microbacterium nymphoidis TaxID=2898586 RepID=UPI001E3BAE3F|nr:RNA methyltransferase [Microbacterium nymphoidis]MCD2497338.1 RNA methyltransferase [Microbacterium nymphoidis]